MSNHQRDLERIAAIAGNLTRLLERGDLRIAARRLYEWEDEGYGPGQADNPTSGGGPSSPTEHQALAEFDNGTRPGGHEYSEIVTQANYWMGYLERVVAEATRDPKPSATELKTTDTADKIRPNAGVCVICKHECTGLGDNRIRRVSGHPDLPLCPSHHRQALRNQNRGVTVDRYVETTKAMLGDRAAS